MKILLLGGCGYSGSRIYQHLTGEGLEVDTVDLEWFGNYINPVNLRMDYRELEPAAVGVYDAVILVAGHSSVAMSKLSPFSAFNNNVRNFIELLQKLGKDQKFIYASSASVYGKTGGTEANEEFTDFLPSNHYDLTKWEIDLYAALSGLNYYGLRFGTLAGYSPGEIRNDIMINRMVETAIKEGRILVSNGKSHRPVLGTHDLTRAIWEILCSDSHPGIYNLASFNSSIADIARKVGKVMGVPVETEKDGFCYDMSMDCNKFCNTFDFEFEDRVETIAKALAYDFDKLKFGGRFESRRYE